jgi:hypothetical protein
LALRLKQSVRVQAKLFIFRKKKSLCIFVLRYQHALLLLVSQYG